MKRTLFVMVSILVMTTMLLAGCGPQATPTPEATEAPGPEVVATEAPVETEAPAPVELTIWHAYHTGEAEEQALNQILAQFAVDHPEITVSVLAVPFDQIFNKWETEVAAGGGPDMFTAPNDNLGNEVRGGLVAAIDDLVAGRLDGYSQTAIDGVTVDGHIYAVPGIAKAVGLFYNTSTVPNPPATTDDLLELVRGGSVLVMRPWSYFNFGLFTGAFGGTLMDDTGLCIADQGGFAEAFQYMLDLQSAGALFEPDEGRANSMFQQGEADMIVTGPWMLGTFRQSLGDNLGVVPLPAGPGGPATPLTGIDGWYINPNSQNQAAAVELALYIFGQDGMGIYADLAGDPPARTDVEITDPLVNAFSEIAAAGFPRPQSVEFGNWWGAFDDASRKVLEGELTPAEAVVEACTTMNTASGR